ncbi:fibronectin type III domain-containing protein, partial [Robinsoniella sp.]
VVWKRDKKASGYQVQYSLSKKFAGSKTKVKTVSKNKTTRLELKKLKTRKTYYVRVRSYKKAGNSKVYGNWSKVKSVKVI